MKIIAAMALTALFTLTFGALSQDASAIDFTSAEQQWLDDNPRITVGSSIWPPYEYVDDDGDLAGVTAAIADRFSGMTGSYFVASPTAAGDWSATLAGLRDGSVDVAFMIEDTGGDNRAGIAFTPSWFPVDTHIIVSADTDRGAITQDNLQSKKIIVVDGYAVTAWLDREGIPYDVTFSTADALRSVANGTHDAHIDNWEVVYRISIQESITGLANSGPSGYTYQNSIGYNQNNMILGGILNKVLNEIGTDELEALADTAILRSNAELIRQSFTDAERQWLNDNPSITVGSSIWPPYEYVDGDGDLAGATAAIADRFSEITGSNFVASPTAAGDWSATLAGLRDGSVDAAFMITDTGDSNRAGIGFTNAWLYVDTHLIVRNGYNTTVADLATQNVVTVRDYAVNSWLQDQGIEFTTVDSTAAALAAVADGTYDVHVENWNVASIVAADANVSGLQSNGPSGYAYALSIGYNPGNHVFGGILTKVLDGIQGEKDRLVEDAILADADDGYDVVFTSAEQAWLDANPVISIGYDPGWPPYEYLDANGKLTGVSSLMAERFSAISGSFFSQADSITSWQDSIDAIRAGDVHALFLVERTPERSAYMDFTSVWQSISIDIVVRDAQKNTINRDNLGNYTVVAVQGYAVTSWLDANMPSLNYITVSSTQEAIRMVADGRADAYLEPWDIANYLAIQNGITGLANAGPLGDTYELSIGYPKNSQLGSILQKLVDATADEQTMLVQDAIKRSNDALATLPFTAGEQAWLDAHPTITFGYDPAWLGVSESVADRLYEISGSRFVPSDSVSSWQDALDGVRDRQIDTILLVERNAERDAYMDFTSPWYVIPVDVITREAQKDMIHRNNLQDYRVVVVEGYAIEAWLATYMPELDYTAVSSTLVALNMIANEQADAYLEPWSIAEPIALAAGVDGVARAGPLGDDYSLAMGYTDGNAILGSILQKMINEIHDERVQIIERGIGGGSTEPTPRICR